MAAYTTIDDPSAHFKVQLYTGNGAANHAITFDDTDTDMQPDLVWIKNRDATDKHCLFDAVRGATKLLSTNEVIAEATDADTLDSFTSDGFQVDADVKVNTNTEKYIAWCWKANGSGSSNTAGSINTTATSANTTSGVSIMTYTGNGVNGATLGHGLGAVPHMMIVKHRETPDEWWDTYHQAIGNANVLFLNSTDAKSDQSYFYDTTPSSTLVTVAGVGSINDSGELYVMYCFAPVQGFSKFGKYTGYDNDDGPFIYTGFRPSIVLIKRTGSAGAWWLANTAVNPGNLATITGVLRPNSNAVETTDSSESIDILANGFKLRQNGGDINYSGEYIYAAFAEAPFVNSNGVPCNAR
jgi:hypothetical protein